MLISQSAREQGFHAALIILLPLALEIRAKFAFAWSRRITADRSLIPVESQPAQAAENHFDCFLRVASDIGILDAQDERAAGVARVKPVKQSRPCSANVQKTGRTRRKSNANFHRRVTMRCFLAQGKY